MSIDGEEVVVRTAEAVLERLPQRRRDVWRYYRLAGEAADGYPLTETALGPKAHPIHGSYMALELLRSAVPGDSSALDAVERLLFASAGRMLDDGQSLRFMYRASSGLTPYPYDFYSALTQAHYLNVFGRLLELRPTPRLADVLSRVFRSMMIPVHKGGVLSDIDGIVSFEEYPSAMPSWVLNGWLTVLNELFEYGVVSRNDEAIGLAETSARSLADLLERYDAPEYWSSRYSLTGNVTHKIFFKGAAPTLKEVVVSHGGIEVHVHAEDGHPYSLAHVVATPSLEAPALTVKAAASIVRYPEPSRVSFRVVSPSRCAAVWKVVIPQFDPRFVSPRGVGQRTLARITVEKGESWITQEVPLDLVMGWAGSPTAFSKNIAGGRFNVYHYLHIKALTQLYEFTGLPALELWRDRWLGYTNKWAQFPLYSAEGIRHDVVDHGSYADAAAYLRDPRVKLRGNKIER